MSDAPVSNPVPGRRYFVFRLGSSRPFIWTRLQPAEYRLWDLHQATDQKVALIEQIDVCAERKIAVPATLMAAFQDVAARAAGTQGWHPPCAGSQDGKRRRAALIEALTDELRVVVGEERDFDPDLIAPLLQAKAALLMLQELAT